MSGWALPPPPPTPRDHDSSGHQRSASKDGSGGAARGWMSWDAGAGRKIGPQGAEGKQYKGVTVLVLAADKNGSLGER